MLTRVKTALRIVTTAYDDELNDMIDAAENDIKLAGVTLPETVTEDALIVRAVVTYCRANFGSPSDYENLKASYDEQKSQLISATGYGLPEDEEDD